MRITGLIFLSLCLFNTSYVIGIDLKNKYYSDTPNYDTQDFDYTKNRYFTKIEDELVDEYINDVFDLYDILIDSNFNYDLRYRNRFIKNKNSLIKIKNIEMYRGAGRIITYINTPAYTIRVELSKIYNRFNDERVRYNRDNYHRKYNFTNILNNSHKLGTYQIISQTHDKSNHETTIVKPEKTLDSSADNIIEQPKTSAPHVTSAEQPAGKVVEHLKTRAPPVTSAEQPVGKLVEHPKTSAPPVTSAEQPAGKVVKHPKTSAPPVTSAEQPVGKVVEHPKTSAPPVTSAEQPAGKVVEHPKTSAPPVTSAEQPVGKVVEHAKTSAPPVTSAEQPAGKVVTHPKTSAPPVTSAEQPAGKVVTHPKTSAPPVTSAEQPAGKVVKHPKTSAPPVTSAEQPAGKVVTHPKTSAPPVTSAEQQAEKVVKHPKTSAPPVTSAEQPDEKVVKHPKTSAPPVTSTEQPAGKVVEYPKTSAPPVTTAQNLDIKLNNTNTENFNNIMGQWYLIATTYDIRDSKNRCCLVVTYFRHDIEYYVKESYNEGNQTFIVVDKKIELLNTNMYINNNNKFSYTIFSNPFQKNEKMMHIINLSNTTENYLYNEKLESIPDDYSFGNYLRSNFNILTPIYRDCYTD